MRERSSLIYQDSREQVQGLGLVDYLIFREREIRKMKNLDKNYQIKYSDAVRRETD